MSNLLPGMKCYLVTREPTVKANFPQWADEPVDIGVVNLCEVVGLTFGVVAGMRLILKPLTQKDGTFWNVDPSEVLTDIGAALDEASRAVIGDHIHGDEDE